MYSWRIDVVYSRDIAGGIGPEVSGGYAEALVDLILALGTIMLDVAVLRLDVVRGQVGDGGNVGVSDSAVITLVVVVGENLPVEVALLIPGVVEDVVLEVVVDKSGLLIDTVEVVLPGDLGGLASVQIHPDEAVAVDVHMNGREIIFVESLDVSLVVFDDDELVASDLISNPVADIGDSVLVSSEEPLSGEDGSPFQFVHGLRSIPGGRQSTDSLLLLLLLRRWSGGSTEVIPQEGHCEVQRARERSSY